MNTTLINKLREKLVEEKILLETELASVGKRSPNNPNEWEPSQNELLTDTAEVEVRASEIAEFEDKNAVMVELEHHYNTILAALKRISEGTYGACRICDAEIELARLQANPAAETCKTHLDN